MIYIIYFILIFINLIYALKRKHSKGVFFVSFIFTWILIFGNTYNPDLNSYKNIYYGDNLYIEPAFRVLTNAFRVMGFEFEFFVAIISFVCLILIFSSFKKYTKNLNFIIAIYMVYPFVLDIIQFRNLIAMSILIFSLRFLLKNDFYNKMIFAAMIVLAGLFHKLYFLYLLFLLINLRNKNLLIKIIIGMTLVFSVFVFLNGNTIPFLDQILPISEKKFERYFTTKLRFGFLVNWSLNLYYLYLINFSKKQIVRNTNVEEFGMVKKYVNLIFWINAITIIFFPLYMLNINFYRLFRNISLINYSVYAITIDIIIEKRGRGYSLLKYVLIIIVGILVLFSYDIGVNFEYIFRPIMENNIMFK